MQTFKEALLDHFRHIQFFLELQDANPFKSRAFRVARESLKPLESDEIERQIKQKELTHLKGIGKGVFAVATEFLETETSHEYQEARGNLPESLLELRALSGLGAKKIRQLFDELHISTLSEMEYACLENRLVDLKGFGEKTQSKLLDQMKKIKERASKYLLSDALRLSEQLEQKFKSTDQFVRVGQLGAKEEIIECFEYLFVDAKTKKQRLSESQSKDGQHLKFYFYPPEAFYSQAVILTSSPNHLKSLKAAAKKEKLELDDDGLKDGNKFVALKSEEEFYQKLRLPYCPPEARYYAAPKKMEWVTIGDLHGVFHAHTQYSDGTHTLKEMKSACDDKGYEYLGISEHSQTAFYAQGLKEAELQKQWKEIDSLNASNGTKILRGIESDILKDGKLDYPDKILKQFDFVIASIHQRYGQKEMTDRLLKAINNKYTTMIGHISGRLLLGREAYAFDTEKIVRACIENKVVIELNSNPHRLDMNWRDLHHACQAGLLTAINPDAHSIQGFDDVKYGIWMARKAQIKKEHIINTWPLQKLESWLKERKAA